VSRRGVPGQQERLDEQQGRAGPRIDNCVQCHAPQSVKAGVVHGGARADCVECHRYHNGEHALQGIGAAARGVPEAQRLDLRQFLSGGTKK